MTSRRRHGARGTALMETAIILPFLLTLIMAVTDFGRLISLRQDMSDAARDAANIVSRGGVPQDGITSVTVAGSRFAPPTSDGVVIVSTITAHTSNDSTPWVIDQESTGGLSATSRIGSMNAKATVPGFTTLTSGMTLTVVELYHAFTPAFPLKGFGLNIYPAQVYELAVF